MSVEVASAYVSILPSMKGFTKRLADETSGAADGAGREGGRRLGSGLMGGLKAIAGPAAAILAGGALVGGFTNLTSLASDFNETASMAKTIFGAQSGAIDKWASGAASNLGLSKSAALDAAASFGDMFRQIGFTGDASAKMSTKVVQAAADLGSFKNLPTADVSDRISAAFRGEYDSLQAVIPNINAARVEHEALALTSKKAAKELTAQDKATAVLAIVQKDGARAMGDFARTSTGAANATKIQTARLEDLKTQAGQALLPLRILGIKGFSALLDMVLKFKASGAFRDFIQQASGSARALADLVQTRVIPVIAGFVQGFRDGTGAGGRFRDILAGVVGVTKATVGWIVRNRDVLIPLTAGVVAMVAAYKTFVAVSKVVAAVTKIAAGAQAALNVVMAMNPIGLVIALIAVLVVALIIAYKKSATFRAIVDGAFRAVATAAKWMWEKAIKPALSAWMDYMGFLGRGISAVWTRVLRPTFAFIAAAWLTAVGTIIHGAAAALGWVPGLGPKLRKASAAFDKFADSVNRSLAGVKSKTITVTATARIGGTGPLRNKPLPLAMGGPVPMTAGAVRGKDSVPAVLMPDEYVIRRDGSNLGDALKHYGWQGYASGGLVAKLYGSNGLRDFAPRMNAALETRTQAALLKVVAAQEGTGPSYGGGSGAHGGTRASLVAFGRMLQARGFSVAEGPPPFGPVHRVHSKNSKHYQGRAIDVNHGAGTSASEQRAIDGIVGLARGYGLDAIWRAPGHYNHAHFSYDRGGMLGPDMVGVNRTGKPERVLTPAQTQSFDRLVSLLESGQGLGGGISGGTFYSYDPHDLVAEQRKRARDAAAVANLA